MNKGSFQKGHTPWNKGLKGIHHSPKTEFKKGHAPHNYKGEGHIQKVKKKDRIEYYVSYGEIGKMKRRTLSQHLWITSHGEIPEGMIVYNNGDPDDIKIENLELISRRELLYRNRNN